MSPLRRAAASLKGSFASGERAVMRGGASQGGGAPAASGGSDSPPAWAERLKRSQTINRGVSAAEVTEKLITAKKTLGLDRIFAQVDWGGLPAALVEDSIGRYATQIAPELRTA